MSSNLRRRKRKSVSRRRSGTNVNSNDYSSLEQRLALTTFVVTSLNDNIANDNLVTLREAIAAANTNAVSGDAAAGEATGDVIQFDSSLANGTIFLTGGQLTISDDLVIQAGNLDITVDAQGVSRALEITGSETVSLGRINVTGGFDDIGGGVLASGSGNLTVFGGEYSGNIATGDGGGAIYSASGNLNVSGGTIFDGNIANGASGSGGAIFNDGGTANVNNATFTANEANRAGGAIEIAGGDLFLTDILADGNIAGPDGSAAPGNGGALHVTAGDLVVVADSTITNNFAALEGGGLWNQVSTRLIVNDTTFENNIANGDGSFFDDDPDGTAGRGGAIFNNGGSLIVNASIFNDNAANGTGGRGGAIFSVDGRVLVQDGSEFSDNESLTAGGAIALIDGEFFDTGSTFTSNSTGVSDPAVTGNGGAFHIAGTGISAFTGTQFVQNGVSSQGGAVWNSATSSTFFTDVTFSENGSGSRFILNDGGGAIFNDGGNVTVNNSEFRNNRARSGDGSGGAIFSVDGRILVFGSSVFTGNESARAGGAIELIDGEFFDTNSTYVGNETGVFQPFDDQDEPPASLGNGGAFHITGTATAAFNGTEFTGNTAASEGGAVWNAAGSTTFLTDVEFVANAANGNDADNGGGAVFNNGGDVFVSGSLFGSNTADGTAGSGGAIFSVDGRVLVQGNSLFEVNTSARAGGAVEIIDGEFFDTDSIYRFNDTGRSLPANPGNGGAFHITGTATASFSGTEFARNRAGSEGGAVWNAAGSTTFLSNVEIDRNVARGNAADNGGGGIFNNGGSVFVNNSTISNNVANGDSGSGGGALSVDGVLRFDNSTISGNQAARAGGGVEVIDGRAVFRTATLDSNTTGVVLTAAPGNGGALHVTGNDAVVTFSNSTVTNNSAANQGGGLWNQTGSTLILDSGTSVANNSAVGVGGGVYNRGFLSAIDAVFSDNDTEDDGGAIYTTPSANTRLENSSLTGNTAGDDGGGVFNLGNVFTLGSSFEDNVADGIGGAIFTGPQANTVIGLDNFFSGNLPTDQNG